MSKSSKKRALFGAASVMPNPTRLQRPTIDLDAIRTDGGTQPRERLDEETLEEYAARMSLDEHTGFVLDPEQQKWPELVVFFDGHDNWLADGFHRYSAARHAGLTSFQVRREEGSQRDAILYSLGVNATHGKRRTNADKRRAIERALLDEEWRQWSDARIASLCKVSSPMVTKLRTDLESVEEIPFEPILYSADGREFERQQATSPAPKRSAPTRKSSPTSSKIDHVKSFKSLVKHDVGSHTCLIAYPSTAAHWELLEAHASTHLKSPQSALIVHLPSSALPFQQLASLSAHFASSHLCYLKAHNRHYALLSQQKPSPSPGSAVNTPKQLLAGHDRGACLTVGTLLDEWG